MNTDNAELEQFLRKKKVSIKIVGTGGAGNNTLDTLQELGVHGVVTVATNTDAQDLLDTKADKKILLGKELTRGLGAGNDPLVGEQSALESQESIRQLVEGSDAVFITCGLGGGTGTGSAPVIAELCKRHGVLTVAVVTLPFEMEGKLREDNALEGLNKLEKHVDAVIVIKNNNLLNFASNLPLGTAFKIVDNILANALKGLVEMVTKPGLVNLDFADFKTVMQHSGAALIGLGESDTDNRAQEAVNNALLNPLLDVNLQGASGALVNIIGSSDFRLDEANLIVDEVSKKLDEDAKIIWGAQVERNLKGIKVMVVITGLHSKAIIDAKAVDGFIDVDEFY